MTTPGAAAVVGRRSNRLPALDLMRFVAAMMVLLYHYGFRGAADGEFLQVAFPELSGWVRYGYLGVPMFFMLSGFVILLTVDAGKGLPSHFVASRISRLYPVFWASAALTFVLMWGRPAPFGVSLHDFVLNLGMVPEWLGAEPVDGVYWTLAVELQFYIYVSLYLLFLQRRVGIDWMLALWLAAVFAVTAIPDARYLLKQGVLVEWGAFFIAGCLYYRVWGDGWTLARRLLLLLAWVAAMLTTRDGARATSARHAAEISPWIAQAVISGFFVLFSLLCRRPRWLAWGGRLAIVFGALTYPLYLVHQNLGYALINALAPTFGRWPALAATVTAMLALAWLLHRGIERPFNGRLRRWLEPRLRFLDFRMPG